jgi:hypothetical protein
MTRPAESAIPNPLMPEAAVCHRGVPLVPANSVLASVSASEVRLPPRPSGMPLRHQRRLRPRLDTTTANRAGLELLGIARMSWQRLRHAPAGG